MAWGRLLPSRVVMPGHPTTSPSPRAASVCEDRFMLLHAERDGAGPPIVLVHGFTQTGRCWGPEAEDLARDHEVIRVDAQIGRAHVLTPVTNAHLVCRLLLEKNNN